MTRAVVHNPGAGPIQIVDLELLPGQSLLFAAGQYVHVRHPRGRRIPFTIATAPHLLPRLQIHFQPVAGNVDAELMQEMIASGEIELEDTQGTVTLAGVTQPHMLFVCAGSGFAQANSMILSASHLAHPARRSLLWCADSPRGFYARDLLAALKPGTATHLFADPRRDSGNAAMRWLRQQAPALSSTDVILCGSPPFVHSVTALLKTEGLGEMQMHSDVYAYAPR